MKVYIYFLHLLSYNTYLTYLPASSFHSPPLTSLLRACTLPALPIPLQPIRQSWKINRHEIRALAVVRLIDIADEPVIGPKAGGRAQVVLVAVAWHGVLPVAVASPVLAGADVDAGLDLDDHIVAHREGGVVNVAGEGGEDGAAEEVHGDGGGGEG
jgi:hypothetical protein